MSIIVGNEISLLADLNHENTPTLDKIDGSAPIAMGEDSLNSSTSGGDDHTDNENGAHTSSSTPQFDQSIRSGTPQAKLTNHNKTNISKQHIEITRNEIIGFLP